MHILMLVKYPPIQGGVSADSYWLAQLFVELGHRVTVLTNADEVEEEQRISLSQEDRSLLRGFWRKGSIRLINSYVDKQHIYIPQGNPTISKLVSLGLGVAHEDRPDLIWSYYLEPYGVAALFISQLTGIPYTIRHAGSDLGRLMNTDQLRTIYQQVFKHASAVISTEQHDDKLSLMGVDRRHILRPVTTRILGNLFFPTEIKKSSPPIVGSYGKVGDAKGTFNLIRAISKLQDRHSQIQFHTHWGGRNLDAVHKLRSELNITDTYLKCDRFIPHWRIPEFIRSCSAMLFLEHGFKIRFHGPSVPLEVLSCGRLLITTEEIANKTMYARILNKSNSIVLKEHELAPDALASRIEKSCLSDSLQAVVPPFDNCLLSRKAREKLQEQLTTIASITSELQA